MILQEILQAFRSDSVFKMVARRMEPFPLLRPERSDDLSSAALHRRCEAKGISATTADCQIAVAAIRNRRLLLTADHDFERIARHGELELA